MSQDSRYYDMLTRMQTHGLEIPRGNARLQIPDARNRLGWTFSHMVRSIGGQFVWQPEYEQVAEWLSDSKGKGLLLYGMPGRGKTFLARYVLPAVLLEANNLVARYYDATALGRNLDEAIRRPIVIIDDVGTESTYKSYGNVRDAFAELVDAAEKTGKMLIATSNLSPEEMLKHYDARTLDRLLAITRSVAFRGESLRK